MKSIFYFVNLIYILTDVNDYDLLFVIPSLNVDFRCCKSTVPDVSIVLSCNLLSI